MRWFRKKLRKLVDWSQYDDSIVTLEDYHARSIHCPDELDSQCIRFKVFKANGGVVVQTDTYDRRTDRQTNALHVIVEGQDLGHEVGKIITYESLKL